MHPHLRQAIAQAHTDELKRHANQRRVAARLEPRTGRPKVARHRLTLRPAHSTLAHQ